MTTSEEHERAGPPALRQARLSRAKADLGRVLKDHLRWLLRFIDRPLRGLDDEEWAVLYLQLRLLTQFRPGRHVQIDPSPCVPSPAERRRIVKAQRAVKECWRTLAERKGGYEYGIPAGRWIFSPPWPRGKGERRSSPIGRSFAVPLPAALLLAAADMLDQVGADLLRICRPKQYACDKLFVADHYRQEFCSRAHAMRDAYLKWWRETKGGTRAKVPTPQRGGAR